MSKKNLLVGIVSSFVLIGLVTGGALAGEGDYPPLKSGTTISLHANMSGKDAANCGRADVREGLTVEKCLSRCS